MTFRPPYRKMCSCTFLDPDGPPSFQALHNGSAHAIVYYAFDALLAVDGARGGGQAELLGIQPHRLLDGPQPAEIWRVPLAHSPIGSFQARHELHRAGDGGGFVIDSRDGGNAMTPALRA